MISTYEMLKRVITNKKEKGLMDETYKEETLGKMDIFLIGNRITSDEYKELEELLKSQ